MGSDLLSLVGREDEIQLLIRLWAQAKAGKGQVVLLSGEPGMGKSRIVAAVQERIEREPHGRLNWFCSPHHADSTLYPVISQLEHAAGFEPEDPAGTKLSKLETLLLRSSIGQRAREMA